MTQQQTAAPLKVSALVSLLQRHDPEALTHLRAEYPDDADVVLKPGIKFGTETETPAAQLYVDTAIASLEAGVQRIQPNIREVRRRLKRAKTFRLAGVLVSTVSSVGLLAAILSKGDRLFTIVTALVNLLGAMCTILAAHYETADHAPKMDLVTMFDQLVDHRVTAERLLNGLRVARRVNDYSSDSMRMVQDANEVSAKLLKAEEVLGTTASV
jgi:hypothetical protein